MHSIAGITSGCDHWRKQGFTLPNPHRAGTFPRSNGRVVAFSETLPKLLPTIRCDGKTVTIPSGSSLVFAMNPDLEKLIALQEADREIERLNQEIALLPRRVAAIESKLADTRARIEKAKAAMAAAQKDRKKLDTEIQDHQQKISKYRDQSLGVKTNEQYKALLQEITFAEQAIRACEDKILDGMLAVETQEKNQKAAEAELKQEMAEIEKEKSEARARTEEDQKQLAEWAARRNLLRSEISADVVPYYDRVQSLRKSGIAEVREDSKCSACNVMLRPQTYNEVRANDRVIACDSCGRILYYVPPPEPAPAPSQAPTEASQPAAESAS
jgi:uncharacterized protein